MRRTAASGARPPSAHLATKEMQEAERDLREFLKVTRPEWTMLTRDGKSNAHRAMLKLKDIGVTDISELMRRVRANTLNMDLSEAGHTRFSEDTIEALRSEASFVRALEYLKEPHYRQTGCFAPVPLLLAKTYTQQWGGGQRPTHKSTSTCSAQAQPQQRRPASSRRRPAAGAWTLPEGLEDVLDNGRPPTAPQRRDRSICSGAMQRCSSAPQGRSSTPQRPQHSVSWSCSDEAPIRERPRLRYCASSRATTAWAGPATDTEDSTSRPRSEGSGAGRAKPLRIAGGKEGGSSSRTASASASATVSTSASGSGSASADGDVALEFDEHPAQPAALHIEAEAERLQQALMAIRSRPRSAAWRPAASEAVAAEQAGLTGALEETTGDSFVLARAADQVLKEMQAVEEKEGMLLQMRREGQHSAMRRVIAANANSRLRGAAPSDGKKAADVHLRAARIRKNLREMKCSRKELQSVRREAEEALFPSAAAEQKDQFHGLRSRFAHSRQGHLPENVGTVGQPAPVVGRWPKQERKVHYPRDTGQWIEEE